MLTTIISDDETTSFIVVITEDKIMISIMMGLRGLEPWTSVMRESKDMRGIVLSDMCIIRKY